MYIQSVGINSKASRIAGLNSRRIIFMTYTICGLLAGIVIGFLVILGIRMLRARNRKENIRE